MKSRKKSILGLTTFLLVFQFTLFVFIVFGSQFGDVHEAVSRNWLLSAVIVLMAINNATSVNRLWKKILITIPVYFIIVATQAYLAYGYFEYDSQNDVGLVITGFSLGVVAFIAFAASLLAKGIDPEFTIFRKYEIAQENG